MGTPRSCWQWAVHRGEGCKKRKIDVDTCSSVHKDTTLAFSTKLSLSCGDLKDTSANLFSFKRVFWKLGCSVLGTQSSHLQVCGTSPNGHYLCGPQLPPVERMWLNRSRVGHWTPLLPSAAHTPCISHTVTHNSTHGHQQTVSSLALNKESSNTCKCIAD